MISPSVQGLPAIPEVHERPTPVDLFLFSAAVGMAHRIHYDADYARDEEGHPGLLVHGSLRGAYICRALEGWIERSGISGRITRLSYRHSGPAYVDRDLVAGGELVSFDAERQIAAVAVWVKGLPGGEVATAGTAFVAFGE